MNAGERGAREEIDKQKKALRTELDIQGALTFESLEAIDRWSTAVDEIVAEGFADSKLDVSMSGTTLEVRRRGRAA